MNHDRTDEPPRMRIFPQTRLENGYPWTVWLIGWFVLLKSFLWTATDPQAAEHILQITGYKHLIATIPFAVLAVGLWNLRKWAFAGIIAACIADLAFFGLFPASLKTMPLLRTDMFAVLASSAGFLVNSPLGDLIVLAFLPSIKKHIGDFRLLDEGPPSEIQPSDSEDNVNRTD
jgi:hypothetical protein